MLGFVIVCAFSNPIVLQQTLANVNRANVNRQKPSLVPDMNDDDIGSPQFRMKIGRYVGAVSASARAIADDHPATLQASDDSSVDTASAAHDVGRAAGRVERDVRQGGALHAQ